MRDSYRKLLSEGIFIGHKLALQELQKQARFDKDSMVIVAKELTKHSGRGEYGEFCKTYPQHVALYWYIGGRKLQPTFQECKDRIEYEYQIEDINALDEDQKWDLFHWSGIL